MENALGKVSSDLSDRDINRPPGNRQQRFQRVRGGGGGGGGAAGCPQEPGRWQKQGAFQTGKATKVRGRKCL